MLSSVSTQLSCARTLLGPCDENTRRCDCASGRLGFKYQELVRTYWECCVWARLPFADLNTSPQTLRHWLMPGRGDPAGSGPMKEITSQRLCNSDQSPLLLNLINTLEYLEKITLIYKNHCLWIAAWRFRRPIHNMLSLKTSQWETAGEATNTIMKLRLLTMFYDTGQTPSHLYLEATEQVIKVILKAIFPHKTEQHYLRYLQATETQEN